MKGALLSALLLIAGAAHATDVPFYFRGLDSQRDVSGINENFRSVVGDLTKLRTDVDAIVISTGNAVYSSTGGFVNFSPSAYTTAQTSFLTAVTGSTISFTVQGTTVACWFQGYVNENASTHSFYMSVGVDSSVSAIPGTNASTVGLSYGFNANSGVPMNMSFYREFQVTAQTNHSFYLGIWSPTGNTLTLPSSTNSGQFGCAEVTGNGVGPQGPAGPAGASGSTVTVNGSLTGDGSSSLPLGVLSSSVAVLGASGYILNQQLDSSSVTKQGFVTLSNLTGTIDTSKILTDAVTTVKILDLNVTTAKLAALSVNTGKISTGAVDTSKILSDAVTTEKIIAGAVDTSRLAADSVTGSKILAATIDTAKLNATIQAQLSAGGNAVTSLTGDVTASGPGAAATTIGALRVTNGMIAALAVDTGKIASGSIDTSKLLTGAVSTAKIVDGAVDTAKLGTASVTTIKINPGAVDTNKIGNDAVVTAGILNANITTAKIADGAIDTTKLGSGAVDTSKIKADAVTAIAIKAGVIDTTKLSCQNLGGCPVVTDTLNKLPALDGSALTNLPSTSGGGVLIATQTWSGSNTFGSAATTTTIAGTVKISTGFVIDFASSLGYTTTQTSFLAAVTGSTGTFTVAGTTVTCKFRGSAGNASADMMGSTLGVDSNNSYLPGTSSTIGAASAYQWNTNAPGTLDFDLTFQVTPGQHSFYLLLRTKSGTLTFPTTTGISATAQWECYERQFR